MGASVAWAKQAGPAGHAGGSLKCSWGQAEEVRAAAWQAAVAKGAGQLGRGEGVDYGPGELDDITESALAAMHSSSPTDADVQP